jgi:DMSO/TMAO reductase YedYZ molybdopterin-dependent catalytic subunit
MEMSRGRGALIGVAAAVVMTAVMAIIRLTTGVLSLPEMIGEGFITLLPPAAFSSILDILQRAAKPTLYIGILVGQLIVGAALGRWFVGSEASLGRIGRLVAIIWAIVGIVVLPILGMGIFGSVLRAGPVVVAIQMAVAMLSFAAALVVLERATHPRETESRSRRALIGQLAGLLAVVGLGGYAWRELRGGQPTPQPAASAPAAPAPAPAATPAGPRGARPAPAPNAPAVAMTVAPNAVAPPPFDVKNITPEVLTAGDFYTVSKNLLDPKVELDGWNLVIDGLVDRPTTYTLADIAALPVHSDYYALQCISNLVGGDQWGNAHWKGTRLANMIQAAGPRSGIRKVIFHGADDYTDSIPLEVALRPDALLAYEMNNEPLTKEHGFPARLLIPGIYGMKNVKWITRIELVDFDYKGYWMQRGWSDSARYQTSSRIDTPRSRHVLPLGEVTIAGVAFAGHRGIDKVEVSLDNGQTWREAQVKPPLSGNAWNLWALTARFDSEGAVTAKVRATDGNGELQIEKPSEPLPDGATGYHTVLFRVG